MALWEYKTISSGKGGFATPALLETYLNQLGKDEWEIIDFRAQPDNPLAFQGLARRPTQRDWTLEEAAATAARAEADKLRAEFAAKFQSATTDTPVAPEKNTAGEEPSTTDIRRLRDTDRDHDPEALADEASAETGDDWDNWEDKQDDLPTFFEAIKPHLRRNQRGPGQSVGIDYLAKRWEIKEADILAALRECGLSVPETEEAEPEYFEFDGDLYWVNKNNRSQLFINTREKPAPVFRTAAAKPLDPADPAAQELAHERAEEKAEIEKRKAEQAEREAARIAAAQARAEAAAAAAAAREAARAAALAAGQADSPAEPAASNENGFGSATAAEVNAADNAAPLENGSADSSASAVADPALLDKIRPLMRRNRRGPGYSGSSGFLARALRMKENQLVAALSALGLQAPPSQNDKPNYIDIGLFTYWLNKDGRGGYWINGRERRESRPDDTSTAGETNAKPAQPAPVSEITPTEREASADSASDEADDGATATPFELESSGASDGPSNPVLASLRLLLKPNKKGSGVSASIETLSRELEKPGVEILENLVAAGLKVPEDAETKPTFVEQAGEIFWISLFAADDSLWLNAKASKSAAKKPARSRTRAPRKPKKDK